MIDEHDARSTRCRRLGHPVPFGYCRTQEGETVCPLILDCWWESFDVRAFLEQHLPPEQMERLRRGRPSKVETILEVVERVRRRAEETRSADQDPTSAT